MLCTKIQSCMDKMLHVLNIHAISLMLTMLILTNFQRAFGQRKKAATYYVRSILLGVLF